MSSKNTINKDLQEERDKINFNIEEFTNFFYNGADKVSEKRDLGRKNSCCSKFKIHLIKFFIENYFLSDSELNLKLDMSYLSYKEKYEEAVRRSLILHKKLINKVLETAGNQDDFM